MSSQSDLHCNRSRYCNLCGVRAGRVLVLSPKPDDPDYTIAWCYRCDGVPPNNFFPREV